MQSDRDLILQIQANYNQLTKAEKKVADYVVCNQEKIPYMSITDLADACEVGDTSVYRFCRTMELQGYQEFKMQLSLSLASKKEEDRGGEKEAVELPEQLMQIHMSAIRESYKLLDQKVIEKAVAMIEAARRVFFFGIGDSLLIAEEARNKFLRITGKVSCITDPHMQSMAAATATKEDLIIIISYSGATKDSIHVAQEAKKAGAGIACITRFRKSPLTVYSDATLLCGANESPLDGGSMAVRLGQLYLIDVLYQEYYYKNQKECEENRRKTTRAVVEKLY